jgi:hypothetical protein
MIYDAILIVLISIFTALLGEGKWLSSWNQNRPVVDDDLSFLNPLLTTLSILFSCLIRTDVGLGLQDRKVPQTQEWSGEAV